MPWGGFIQGGDAALRRLSYSARVTRDIALDGVREREKPWWFLFIDPGRFAYMKVTAVLWRRGSIPPPPNIPFFFFYSSACQPLLDSTRDDHENTALRRVAWVRSFRWGRVDGWAKIDRINRKPREYDDDDDEEVLVTRRASSDTLAWIMTGTRRANFIGYLTFRWFVVVGSMRASASRLRPTCWNFGLSREIPAPAPNVFLDRPLGEVSGMPALWRIQRHVLIFLSWFFSGNRYRALWWFRVMVILIGWNFELSCESFEKILWRMIGRWYIYDSLMSFLWFLENVADRCDEWKEMTSKEEEMIQRTNDIIDHAITIEDERELSTLDGKAIILAGRCF